MSLNRHSRESHTFSSVFYTPLPHSSLPHVNSTGDESKQTMLGYWLNKEVHSWEALSAPQQARVQSNVTTQAGLTASTYCCIRTAFSHIFTPSVWCLSFFLYTLPDWTTITHLSTARFTTHSLPNFQHLALKTWRRPPSVRTLFHGWCMDPCLNLMGSSRTRAIPRHKVSGKMAV